MNTTYVVCDENTLGYTIEGGFIGILRASVLKGSTLTNHLATINASYFDTIRTATTKDFKEYRVKIPPNFEE